MARIRVLISGLCGLILMIGIARFTYTPLLPIMQAQTFMGDALAGWLATYNYMGYMCGALLAASISDLQLKDRLYRVGILVAILTTAGMAITESALVWSLMRFFAGLSSAAAMLLSSGLIMHWLLRHNFRTELGIHFSGVGLGIAFCAIVVHLFLDQLNWSELWWLFSFLGIFLAIPAWRWLPKPDLGGSTLAGKQLVDCPPSKKYMRLMLAAYFCAGYGYVISATFIVAIVEHQPSLTGMGPMVLLIVGLAAAPSGILWDLIARRIGELQALLLAFLIQVIGIVLPAISDSLLAAIGSAVLYGGTFVGIVSLVLSMAGRFYPTKPAKLMGKMTLSYGVAQIIAPAFTGIVTEKTGNYDIGLWLAGFFTLIGAVFILALQVVEKREQEKINT